MIKLYGISNCDSVKKAKTALESNQVTFQFHDFKKEGISRSQIDDWANMTTWETLLNKRSTTWRTLGDANKNNITQEKACSLMQKNPTLIKRPVLINGQEIKVGFDEEYYQSISS